MSIRQKKPSLYSPLLSQRPVAKTNGLSIYFANGVFLNSESSSIFPRNPAFHDTKEVINEHPSNQGLGYRTGGYSFSDSRCFGVLVSKRVYKRAIDRNRAKRILNDSIKIFFKSNGFSIKGTIVFRLNSKHPLRGIGKHESDVLRVSAKSLLYKLIDVHCKRD